MGSSIRWASAAVLVAALASAAASCGPEGGGGFSGGDIFAHQDTKGTDDGASAEDADASTPDGILQHDQVGSDGSCMPACGGKDCGSDGCGGVCGTCPAGTSCDATGHCVAAECGSLPLQVDGTLQNDIAPLTFENAAAAVIHKRDVDLFEDGCISGLTFTFSKGDGCTLSVTAGERYDLEGRLAVQSVSFCNHAPHVGSCNNGAGVCDENVCCTPECGLLHECGDDKCGGDCGPCAAGQICVLGLCL